MNDATHMYNADIVQFATGQRGVVYFLLYCMYRCIDDLGGSNVRYGARVSVDGEALPSDYRAGYMQPAVARARCEAIEGAPLSWITQYLGRR